MSFYFGLNYGISPEICKYVRVCFIYKLYASIAPTVFNLTINSLFMSEGKFIVPDWEDKVDYDIGVVVPTRQVRQPYAIVDFIPQSRTMNLATVLYLFTVKKLEI